MGAALSLMKGAPKQPTKAPSRDDRSQTGGATTGVTGQDTGPGVTGVTGVSGATTPMTDMSEFEFDGCGLENDADEWEDNPPQPRIRETQLTAEEQTKFRGLLDKIFDKWTLMGKMVPFDPEDVFEVMVSILPYLKSEPVLIEDVPLPISIVGDLHGQLHDLDRVFSKDAKDGKPGWECAKYLFLGNYVDRGRQSLEVIMALYIMKMLYPDNIILLRGNHEFMAVNIEESFIKDTFQRFEETMAMTLYFRINESFCYLSVGAIVGDLYFCSHGGISPSFFSRRHFRGIYKPIVRSTDDSLVQDVVWSDPAFGLKGTAFNAERGASSKCGPDVYCVAMETMGVKGFFRAHSRIDKGFEGFYEVLFTVFTATATSNSSGKGAVAVLDEKGKVFFRVLGVDMERTKWETKLKNYNGQTEDNGCHTTMKPVPQESVENGAIKRM